MLDKGHNIKKPILEANVEEVRIPLDKMSSTLDTIKRKYKFALAKFILRETMDGNIVPIFSEELNLSKAIPGWVMVENGKFKAVINFSGYRGLSLDPNGYLDGDPRTIFSLLQAGYLLKTYYEIYDRLVNNYDFLKEMCLAYVKLFTRILDKLFSIGLNSYRKDLISFLVGKFFFVNLVGKDATSKDLNDMVFRLICVETQEGLIEEIKGYDELFNKDDIYGDIKKFIDFLSRSDETLNKLNFTGFFREWMLMYDYSCNLALELLEYLIITIAYVAVGSNVNKGYVIDKIVRVPIAYNKISEAFRT